MSQIGHNYNLTTDYCLSYFANKMMDLLLLGDSQFFKNPNTIGSYDPEFCDEKKLEVRKCQKIRPASFM